MKYSLLFAAFCLGLSLSLGAAAQVISDPVFSWSSGNVVYEFTSRDGTTAAGNLTVNYHDDFGRLQQTVLSNYMPGKDLVSKYDYDVRGNKVKAWLPAVISGNDTKYVDGPTCETACAQTYDGDGVCYSAFDYEPSSLSRPIKQKGPGSGWGSGSAVSTSYQTNTQECWDVRFTGDNSYSVAKYAAGKLHVTRTQDEDGTCIYEYKDFSGRTIFSRTEDTFFGSDTYETYYVYDDLGHLRAILPPKCSETLTVGNFTFSSIENRAYLYRYDTAEHLIAKKLPDADWIYYVYDKADRPIFSQTGNQREKGEWSFNIPDKLGRECLVGVCKNVLSYDSNFIGESYITCSREGSSGAYMDYDVSGITLVTPVIHKANYYDSYDMGFDVVLPLITENEITPDIYWAAQGLLVGTVTARFCDTGVTVYDYCEMYYDNRGRLVVQAKSPNLRNEYETEITEYNYSGQPVCFKRCYYPTTSGSSSEVSPSELYTYTYDDWGRLLTTTHRLEADGATVVLADNEYDDVGRLKTNKRNSNPNLITDYSYNIRSWLSSISNPLFSQSLYYQENFEDYNYPRNGGDITAMTWQTASEPQRGYIFNYDGISRLTAAEYLENDMESNKFGVSYSYDKHGNVTELQRYGRTGNESYGLIDNIPLAYSGNKMTRILGVAALRTTNLNQELPPTFNYDRNGNMTKDLSRSISEIQYNSLNLPTKITFNNNEAIENRYVYSATGQKLQVTKQNLSGEHITDYIGSNIYENGSLKRTLIAGGYIEDGQYYYYLTDHLGSTRVVSTASGEVVQTNHYYPYGLTFAEGVDTSNQPYLFNGKEFDRDRSLNLYDYGARFMAPDWGRFTTIDPLSEIDPSVSPYAYCRNNPIRFIDPDGRMVDDYFNFAGEYLGTDNSSTDYVRIINNETWDMFAENGTINPSIGVASSSLFSQTQMSDQQALNVYQHYNMTGIPLTAAPSISANMRTEVGTTVSRSGKKVVDVQVNKISLLVNMPKNATSGLFDNASNITSTFEHEDKHVKDVRVDPVAQYNRTQSEQEIRAIEYQQQSPTYRNTTPDFQKAVNKYKAKFQYPN